MAKPKIALVNDHISTVTCLSNHLESSGFQTVWAYTPEDAIALYKKEKPDIMIIDWTMGKIQGCELAKQMPGQKIFFTTTLDDLEEKCKKCKNCLGIVKKPVDAPELEARIKKVLKL